MEVIIFDVEHGSCNAVLTPTGQLLLIDCGHNDATRWRPSSWIAARRLSVANLTITNFDEDHVTDLPNLYATCPIQSLTRNWHVTPDWVRSAKSQYGMGPGIRTAVRMMESYNGPPAVIDWGCQLERFCHPVTRFQDENSLSVVTFVHYLGLRIVFPGDLTRQAWEAFLQDPTFRAWLAQTNIFVASHHGREDGYCPAVFDVCKPNVIIASDRSVAHETQRVAYGRHATGIRWNGTETRSYLTTRCDGTLTITPTLGGGFYVRASQ